MEITVEKKKDSRITTTIVIGTEEHKDAESKALRSLAERVNIKGFRAGKAPDAMVRERVGEEDVVEETVRVLLPRIFKEALAKSGAKPVIRPSANIVKKNPLTISLTFVERPDVTLKKPDSITVEKKAVSVSDDEIEVFIKKILMHDKTETLVDRAAKKGDSVKVALTTKDKEGKEVKELTVGNYTLILGEEELLPELEEPMLGMKKGEVKSVEVSFGKEHDIPSVRGKKLSVSITVHSVSEIALPTLTGEYLTSKLKIEKSPEEFRKDIKTMLQSQKQDAEMKRREDALYEAVKLATVVKLPEELVDAEAQDILADFVERLKEQGTSLEDWMKQSKKEPQKLLDEMKEISVSRSTLRLGMQELAKHKKIEAPEALLQQGIEQSREHAMSQNRKVSDEEFLPGGSMYEQIRFDLIMRTLVETMIGSAA